MRRLNRGGDIGVAREEPWIRGLYETAGTHGPVGRRRGRRRKEPIMAMDIQDDQKVVVYKDGVDQYEGLWGNRDEDYDGDFYLLADVEEADIIVVC